MQIVRFKIVPAIRAIGPAADRMGRRRAGPSWWFAASHNSPDALAVTRVRSQEVGEVATFALDMCQHKSLAEKVNHLFLFTEGPFELIAYVVIPFGTIVAVFVCDKVAATIDVSRHGFGSMGLGNQKTDQILP